MAPQVYRHGGKLPYRELADALREQIRSGELQPGDKLPSAGEMARTWGMNRNTVIRALSTLEGEGLVIGERGRGTFVRTQPVRRRVARDRFVYRDARGYYFDRAVKGWVPLHPALISTASAGVEAAGLLGVGTGELVLTRYRRLGPPGGAVGQVSTSFLPGWVVEEIPRLGSADTGPGGIYDLLERGGYAPLSWMEMVWARMPSPEESSTLLIDPGVPVLAVGRVTREPGERVVEANVTIMPADRFEVGYQVQRSAEALAPVAE